MIAKKIAKNIIPRVRPSRWFETYNMNTVSIVVNNQENNVTLKKALEISCTYYIPYEDDLSIGFAYEAKEGEFHIVTKNDVKKWKISDEELIQLAIKNIPTNRPHFSEIRTGVFGSNLNNTCDSGLMLLKDEISALKLEGNPIVFCASRDAIYLCGSEDNDSIIYCAEAICKSIHNKGVTIQAYTLVDNKWVKAELTGEDKSIKEYNFLVVDEVRTLTNELIESYKEIYPYKGKEIIFSKLTICKNEKGTGYILYSTWVENDVCRVPKADLIALISKEEIEDETIQKDFEEQAFPWEVLQEVCSHYLTKLDFENEIWEFKGFPSPEEFDRLTKLSYPDYIKPSKFKKAINKLRKYIPFFNIGKT